MIHPTGQTYVTVGCIYFLPTLGFPIVVIRNYADHAKMYPADIEPAPLVSLDNSPPARHRYPQIGDIC